MKPKKINQSKELELELEPKMETKTLNEKQKMFCDYYVSKEFFGNGVESYAEAYNIDLSDPKKYRFAAVNASKLLIKTNICSYVNQQLDEAGLNDNFVDKQLLMVVTQHADLHAKMKGIEQYNKLKARITDKAELKHNIDIDVTLNLD